MSGTEYRNLNASIKTGGSKILHNQARCQKCGVTIESKHVHDFVSCECGNLSVDGGREYVRRLIGDPSTVEELSVYG